MANIQIPESLFYDIIRYYLIASKREEIPEELDKRVFNGLSDKVQKIADREHSYLLADAFHLAQFCRLPLELFTHGKAV